MADDDKTPIPRGRRGGRGAQGVQGLQGRQGVMGESVLSDALPRYAVRFIKFMVPAYILMVIAFGVAMVVMKGEIDDRIGADRRQVLAADFTNCEQRNLTKDSLRGVIDAALGSGSGTGDLTKVPGFESLDPSMQQYLRNLSTASANSDDQGSSRDRLLAFRDSLVNQDCEAIKATQEQKLDG